MWIIVFFCKANKEECEAILHILKWYEAVSRQQINFLKSSIQFGNMVDETVQTEMKEILGISNLGGIGSYLGIPKSLRGTKQFFFFNFVRERLQDRINEWTKYFFSKGGKEVLIKSVASTLLTYVMSCFGIPKETTKKLTSAVTQFWWSSNGSQQRMHWVAWKKICHGKTDGDLGFRTIEDFNTTLLAKQLWRLMDNLESLLQRFLKADTFGTRTRWIRLDHIPPHLDFW